MIRARMGISVDGYIASPNGAPALLSMPSFEAGVSYGHEEFIEQCDAVVMGRSTFEPALGAANWPWPDLQVYVLTSRPLPDGAPDDVIASKGGPEGLVEQLRKKGTSGDVELLGGARTVQALLKLDAVDTLELIVLPILLGDGIPLFAPGSSPLPMEAAGHKSYPDGAIELDYVLSGVQL